MQSAPRSSINPNLPEYLAVCQRNQTCAPSCIISTLDSDSGLRKASWAFLKKNKAAVKSLHGGITAAEAKKRTTNRRIHFMTSMRKQPWLCFPSVHVKRVGAAVTRRTVLCGGSRQPESNYCFFNYRLVRPFFIQIISQIHQPPAIK